jgi:hypothetical protein
MPYNENMNRSEITYHRDIFIPTNITVPQRVVSVTYHEHAVKATKDDRYGSIPKAREVDLANPSVQIIEVTVDAETRRLTKILIRLPHPDRERDDIVLVLRTPEVKTGPWLAVTTWVNRRDDKHRTLDHSRYATR